MRPIDASKHQIRVTYHWSTSEPVKPPEGEGWLLHAMSAESAVDGEQEGGCVATVVPSEAVRGQQWVT
jgi:hypothetical protein